MFKHIVLFKTKKQEDAQFVFDRLRSMEGKIKELKYLEVGIDELHTERSFDVTLITGFDSKEDMDIYQVSDYHQNEVLAKIKPLIEKSIACDYNEK